MNDATTTTTPPASTPSTAATPVCTTCKRPLERSSAEFWVCLTPRCRGLIGNSKVEMAIHNANRNKQGVAEA